VKGYGKRENASHALNEEDEEFLWQSGQLGKHSAQALVNVNSLFFIRDSSHSFPCEAVYPH